MGASVSMLANRRQSRIVAAEVREDNIRLQVRIQSLSEETSRLKAELREIADTRIEKVHGPVQKVQVETDLSQCPLPNRCVKVFVPRKKLRFGTDLPQCSLPKQLTSTRQPGHCQLKLEKVLGARIYRYDCDGNLVGAKQNGH